MEICYCFQSKGVSKNLFSPRVSQHDCYTQAKRLLNHLIHSSLFRFRPNSVRCNVKQENGTGREIEIWWLTKENWNFICYLKFFSVVNLVNKIVFLFPLLRLLKRRDNVFVELKEIWCRGSASEVNEYVVGWAAN